MVTRTNTLTVALVFALLGAGMARSGEPQPSAQPHAGMAPVPLWDGKESIADYAKRASLEPKLTLDLGGGVKLELVLIPAGKFIMGSPETEKDRNKGETQHEVTVSQAFYLGKYVVTQEQYEKVMGANPSYFKGAKNPVEMVTWDDAQDFCKKLSTTSGKALRLPAEAEWEYSCRAGSTTAFCFGDNEDGLTGYAWYCINSKETPHPVGEKKPNVWGLYGMHGNVWQWCQDWYADYPSGAATDPQGPAQSSALVASRVLRGGSWDYGASDCRSASRSHYRQPFTRNYGRGFRVVVVAPKAAL